MEPPLPMFGLRPLLPDSGCHKGTRDCTADKCARSTREGKPFCSRHIEQSDYIQEVLAKLAAAKVEESILEAGRTEIPRAGFYVKEAVLLLRTKDFTVKSFSRRLDISHKATDRLIQLLVKWGLAQRNRNGRGGKSIRGIAPKDLVDGI